MTVLGASAILGGKAGLTVKIRVGILTSSGLAGSHCTQGGPGLCSQFIDEIRDRQGIRLLTQTRTEFLPTTAQADQKSSMGATWPEPEASRASLVTSAAPSFSASTM
jgi:hypothetical protein